jgi:alkylated DNA nucleotide flippase Atl1
MAATPSGKGIPWHRVVGDRGRLLIPEPYASLQRKLLQTEGVAIVEFRVDLHTYLWTPASKGVQHKPSSARKRKRRSNDSSG